MRVGWEAVFVFGLLTFVSCETNASEPAILPSSDVVTCQDVAPPSLRHNGVKYSGWLKNSTYRFSARIPSGRSARGAGEGAPFHGFVMLLSSGPPESCLEFSIGVRVEVEGEVREPERPRTSVSAETDKKVMLGNRPGMETVSRGVKDGVLVENIWAVAHLSRQLKGESGPLPDIVDVGVLLVAPADDRKEAEAVFRRFLADLKFE